MTRKDSFSLPVVALLVAALVSVPLQGALRASEGEDRAAEDLDAGTTGRTILASALRLASAEGHRLARQQQTTAAGGGALSGTSGTSGTSVAEKLACVYLLLGGAFMLAYGPTETEGGVWTMDGKSETVGGAAAIVLSVALMHDIWKRRTPPAAGGR